MAVSVVLLAALARAAATAGDEPCAFDAKNLSGFALQGPDAEWSPHTTAQACMAECCRRPDCTAWNYHVSSTDPTHHPLACWLSNSTAPNVAVGEHADVWVGGSRKAVHMVTPHAGHGSGTGGGAEIQPLSKWFYYGEAGNLAGTLDRELTDQSIKLLHERAATVAALGDDPQKWRARQAEVFGAFGGSGSGPFAPLPPPNRSPPKYKVTKTLTRPGYTCELVLYETRPGFFASGSIWTPTALKKSGGKAPGVLMVSGHTDDGFRSNNLGGPIHDNDPPDDDYEVVEINLVSRGFVVLAFDP